MGLDRLGRVGADPDPGTDIIKTTDHKETAPKKRGCFFYTGE